MFGFGNSRLDTPPVVKNIIYLNVIMFLATWVLNAKFNINLEDILAAHYFKSDLFRPYQLVTHMFMHGSIMHIFFNMFGLWMFGRILEKVWGSKRFFIYYFVTGLGAIGFNMLVQHFQLVHLQNVIHDYAANPNFTDFSAIMEKYVANPSIGLEQFMNNFRYNSSNSQLLSDSIGLLKQLYYETLNTGTIGASGAVYGVLLAFGMLFPNTELMLIFPPIPIKAKWIVIIYGAIELYSGFTQSNSNIAHFAHLGGMLFGFILIKYWNSKRTNFY